MKIEIGKTYRCRNGLVGTLSEDREQGYAELYGGYFDDNIMYLYEVGGDGRVWPNAENEFDIVACVDDELPEECAVVSGMTGG